MSSTILQTLCSTHRGIALCTLIILAGCAADRTNGPSVGTAEHRIAIRLVGGKAEFYDRVTGSKFTPRGNNYTRLNTMDRILGGTTFYHSTFNPAYYDSTRCEQALTAMDTLKYNVVRVYLNGMTVGGLAAPGGGLSSPYVANLADFIKRAKVHGIFVILTLDFIPDGPPYSTLLSTSYGPLFQSTNLYYLTAGGVSGVKVFWTDLIHALAAAGAPLGQILAYQLQEWARRWKPSR